MPISNASSSAPPEASPHASRTKVLDAALQVIRAKGYAATTVDDLCATAGLTKGSFFHHFPSKEAMTLAAVAHWNAVTGELFAHAPYRRLADPRDRVLAYIDFRKQILQGEAAQYSCLLGTLVQETFDTHPHIRDACNDGIARHARGIAEDIAAAKALYAAKAAWDPMVLASFTQATLQGAFVLAKAQGSSRIVADCLDHLRQHVANLLGADAAPAPPRKERKP
jgi:TetR/AcrR family transcriptional regulator, transcriptional repressor for nem operon